MVLLYLFTYTILNVTRILFQKRASRLENRYAKVAISTDQLVKELKVKPGNGNQTLDTCILARRQYELGRLVTKRDRLESLYARWANRADRLITTSQKLKNWKGRTVPYFSGILDVALCALAALSTGFVDGQSVKGFVDQIKIFLN